MSSGAAAARTGERHPLARVLELDAQTAGVARSCGFLAMGTLAMGILVAGAGLAGWLHDRAPAAAAGSAEPQPIDVTLEPPEPPAPVPPAPEAEVPEAKAPAPQPARAPRSQPAAPPPVPAQAGSVLAQEPKDDDPVDLTGMVQGNGDAYRGGFTTATGTGTSAAFAPRSPTGTSGGRGSLLAAPAPERPDRSRAASVSGDDAEWTCPFPPEADAQQIDDAYVTLQVQVGADGRALSATVLTDPGSGFGREARRCAMARRFAPARDRDGNSVPGATRPFRVHFSR